MTARYPACYIRESSEDAAADPEKAKEGQRIDCRYLAGKDGIDPVTLVEYDDWGQSGSAGKVRPAQDRLIADIKAGRVSVVYARSEDRLMRSARGLEDFEALAREHDVRIVTEREGDITGEDADADFWKRYGRRGGAEYESRVGRLRARKAVETKRRNGTPIGQTPYGTRTGEDVGTVVAAFREAGSYNGAAKLLNGAGVPSRRGHLTNPDGSAMAWSASIVKSVILRAAKADPGLGLTIPHQSRKGSRTVATHALSRLVRCPFDRSIMTTIPRPDASVAYICREGHRRPDHPRPYVVAETRILPWVKEMAARYESVEVRDTIAAGPDAAKLAEIAAKRERIHEMVKDLAYPMVKARLDFAALDEEEAKLAVQERRGLFLARVMKTGTKIIDWSDPGKANAGLRELWRAIDLEYVPVTKLLKGQHTAAYTLAPVGVEPMPGVPDPLTLQSVEDPDEDVPSPMDPES